MRNRLFVTAAALLGTLGLLPGAAAKDPAQAPGPDRAKIVVVAKEAQLVFTATVTAVKVTGQLRSKPPISVMDVTVKDAVMLKGPTLEQQGLPATFQYQAVEGQDFVPKAEQKALVFGNTALAHPIMGGPPVLPGGGQPIETKLNVLLLVAATDENVALAREVVGPNTPEGRLEAAVRSADLVFTATVDKVVMFGMVQPPIQQVTVKDVVMLKGEKPAHLDCRYPRTADRPFNPDLRQKVLCAAQAEPKEAPLPPDSVSGRHTGPLPMLGGNGPEIVLMVEATDANVALARKAIGVPSSRPERTREKIERS